MRMLRKIKYFIGSGIAFLPLFAFAQGQPRTLIDLIDRLKEILNALVPLLFGLALIGFLWGVAQFILQADNEEKRKEGRQIMIWGLVGLFVMTAVWGIVLLLGGTFGIRFLERLPEGGGSRAPSSIPQNLLFDYLKEGFDSRGI